MPKLYTIEILNKDLEKVAEVQNPYPLNNGGDILRYSNELSDWGKCSFRVATKDPILTTYGDILEPHKYHIRIRRYQEIVWQGAIIDNPHRNKNFIEVMGGQYEFYLDKKRVKRDAETTAGDGKNNYRLFNTGSMATAVTNVINEMVADAGGNHILANMSVGDIENPNFPNNFTNSSGTALTGSWAFSDIVAMQFDYHSILHVLKSFGAVANCDFEVDNDLQVNFKKFLGTRQYDVGFVYGTHGNIIDYDLPRYGKRMINDYYGLATDDKGALLRLQETDSASIDEYGKMEGSTAFSDVINNNVLRSRLREELNFLKRPETAPVNVVLDDKTYSIGTWHVGDIVNVRIKDNIIDFNAPRRIVGMTVTVHNTGKELAHVQTNAPRDNEMEAV